MRRAFARVVVAFALAVGGCSLFTDTDGFTDGPPSHGGLARTNEAGSAMIDGGALPVDAGADADAALDLRPYCDRASHAFCADFATNITDLWSERPSEYISSTGQLTYVANDGVTTQGALEATDQSLASEHGGNFLFKRMSRPMGARVELHFAVKPVILPDVYTVIFTRFTYGNMLVYIECSQEGVTVRTWTYNHCELESYCDSPFKMLGKPLAKGQWSDITVMFEPDVGADAATSLVRLRVNGVEVTNPLPAKFNKGDPYFSGEYQLWLGYPVVFPATTNSFDVLFDDVSLDISD